MKIYNVDYYVPIQLMVLIYVVLIIETCPEHNFEWKHKF